MIEVKREQDVSREARQEDDTSGGVVEPSPFLAILMKVERSAVEMRNERW